MYLCYTVTHPALILNNPNLHTHGCMVYMYVIKTYMFKFPKLYIYISQIFFHRSVAFIDDLSVNQEAFRSPSDLFNEIENKYEQGALNCWIAALMYVATLCVSVQQFWMNERIVEIKAERM